MGLRSGRFHVETGKTPSQTVTTKLEANSSTKIWAHSGVNEIALVLKIYVSILGGKCHTCSASPQVLNVLPQHFWLILVK